ncbi:MAG: hypothetical protein LBQ05_01285 [Christensenellaceae bacterium]|jgi:hypothetical protein|nr:hypothetical protein [Christensenellaceae bacterium]
MNAQETLNGFVDKIGKYKTATLDNYIAIGRILNEIKTSNLHFEITTRKDGTSDTSNGYPVACYTSSYELIKDYFGYSKSATANYIAVAKEFGQDMETIQPQYKNFDFTCLVVMLSLTPEQRKAVTPEMSCADIKKLKKCLTPKEETDEPQYEKDNTVILHFTKDEFKELCEYANKVKMSPQDYCKSAVSVHISNLKNADL